jgi:hypothetical protein
MMMMMMMMIQNVVGNDGWGVLVTRQNHPQDWEWIVDV